jgi:hypothetical protein
MGLQSTDGTLQVSDLESALEKLGWSSFRALSLDEFKQLSCHDDDKIREVFDRYKTGNLDTLPIARLGNAFQDLESQFATQGLNIDEFTRLARLPSESEHWIRLLPLESLLSRCLDKFFLRDLEHLSDDDIQTALHLFQDGVEILLKKNIETLRATKDEEFLVASKKFGGEMAGGTIQNFHDGLSNRVGTLLLLQNVAIQVDMSDYCTF